jgi:phosphoglycolate phosphatase-like HAD superfamily hydrolase
MLKTLIDVGPDPTAIYRSLTTTTTAVLESALATLVFFVALLFYGRLHQTPHVENAPPLPLVPSTDSASGEGTSTAEAEYLDAVAFVRQADLSTVVQMDVIAITGEVTLRPLCEALECTEDIHDNHLRMRVLLRSDSSSDAHRIEKKRGTRQSLQRLRQYMPKFDYELRGYSTVLPLCCVILLHDNGLYSAHLTLYDWHRSKRMTGRESHTMWYHVCRSVDVRNEPLLSVFQSWFDRLWGKHKLHTLVFDFDDTLFRTTDIAVSAWATAVLKSRTDGWIGDDELSPMICAACADWEALLRAIKEIYLIDGQERAMLERVFRVQPSEQRLRIFQDIRIEARERATLDEAMPVAELTTHLQNLRSEYQLVVISATSEKTIKAVLEKHDLDIFAYILGRDIANEWKGLEGKTHNFIRAANMIGTPLERMALVGDSDADYRVTDQLGVPFIESRLCNAAWNDKESLVYSRPDGEDAIVVGGRDGLDLLSAISRVEARLAEKVPVS